MPQPTLVRALAVAIALYTAFASLLGTLVMLARDEVAGGMVSAVRGAGGLVNNPTPMVPSQADTRQALAADKTVLGEQADACQDRYGFLGGYSTLAEIVDHKDELLSKAPPLVAKLKSKRYFIAALLHNNENVLSFWQRELIKVAMALANESWDNIYISVYESGSSDLTKVVLLGLDNLLKWLGVPHTIDIGEPISGMTRVEHLAALRNQALGPLYEAPEGEEYDEVIYLNDIYFCAADLLDLVRVVANHGADYSCSVDYVPFDKDAPDGQPDRLYDTWVARDHLGTNMAVDWPYICDKDSQEQFQAGEPFQVFTCWNGMVAIKADVFQELGVRFRASHQYECRLSECDILVRDMWALGRDRVVMVPTARTAYEWEVFYRVADREGGGLPADYNRVFQHPTHAPRDVQCCPLDETDHVVRFDECFHDANWKLGYEALGVPLATSRRSLEARLTVPQNASELAAAIKPNFGGECERRAAELRIPSRLIHAVGTKVGAQRSDQLNKLDLRVLSYVARHPCWSYEQLDDPTLEAAALSDFPNTARRLGYARNLGLRVDLLRLAYMLNRGGVLLPAQSWGMAPIDELLLPEDRLVVGVGVDGVTGERRLLFLAAVAGCTVLADAVEEALRLVAEPNALYARIAASEWSVGPPEDRERYHGGGLGLILATIASKAQREEDSTVRVVEFNLAAVDGVVGKPEDACAKVLARGDIMSAVAAAAAETAVMAAFEKEVGEEKIGSGEDGELGEEEGEEELAERLAAAEAAAKAAGAEAATTWELGPVAVHRGATDGNGGGYRMSRVPMARAVQYDHLRTGTGLMEGQYLKPLEPDIFIPTDPYWESDPLTDDELNGWDPANGLFLWVPYGGAAGLYAGLGPLDPRNRLVRKLCDKPDRDLPADPHLTMLVLQNDHNLVLYAEPTDLSTKPVLTVLWSTETMYTPPPPPPHMPDVRVSLEPPPAFLGLRADGRLALYKGLSPDAYRPVEPYSHPNFLPFSVAAPGMRRSTHPSLVLIGTAKGGTSDFHQLILARYCHLFNNAQVKELDGLRYTGGYSGRIAYENIISGKPHGLPIKALDITREQFATRNLPYDLQKFVGNEVYLWRLNATGPMPFTIDATPTYLDWGPSDAVHSLQTITNASNIMVFLREPVSRTHSLFNHWLIMRLERGEIFTNSELSFEQEVEMQLNYFDQPATRKVMDFILNTDDYQTASQERDKMQREIKSLLGKIGTDYYSPLLSSLYLPSLMMWAAEYFQRGRALVVQSDMLFSHKQECMEQVVGPFLFADQNEREFVPQCAGNLEAMYHTDTRKQHYHELANVTPQLKCRLHRFYQPFNLRMLDELRRMSDKVHIWPPIDTEEGTWWDGSEEKYCGEEALGGNAPPPLADGLQRRE